LNTAVPVDRDRRAVPRRQLGLGGRVPGLGEAGRILLARRVAQRLRVAQAERHPAAERRVGAGEGVGEQREARDVGGQAAVAVDDAAHGQRVRDRLAVEPMGV
jgi:hypothetical protein